jgi:hypothetical protein
VITYYGEEFSEMDETKLSKSISWSGPQRRCNELQTTCAAWKHVYIRFQREIERERERESSLDGVAGQKNVQLNADASRTVHMCGVGAALQDIRAKSRDFVALELRGGKAWQALGTNGVRVSCTAGNRDGSMAL